MRLHPNPNPTKRLTQTATELRQLILDPRGITECTVRVTSPSRFICRNLLVSIFWLVPPTMGAYFPTDTNHPTIISGEITTMKITGNTILITGGGSGIGRGLAEDFHKLGNKVIIAGRRKHVLDEITAANPGMASAASTSKTPPASAPSPQNSPPTSPRSTSSSTTPASCGPKTSLPSRRPRRRRSHHHHQPARPHPPHRRPAAASLKQPHATIINVSSGLAFVPLAMTPTYCATKAAIHSYTESLRYQLKPPTSKSRTHPSLCPTD